MLFRSEKYGILNPLIVRPVPDGYYEIISGHRRKHAAEKLGYRKVPVIIRVLSEDDSILSMVDSNLHRERISYSEKAFAYKLKNDVLKRKSGRKKSQVDHKTPRKRAIEIISEDCGDSPKQVQRYISLTKLIPEMLQKLDDEIISFCPAVEIAALSEKEQRELLVAMEYAQAIPSLSQAQRIRQLSKEKQLSLEKMEEIMCEVKNGEGPHPIKTEKGWLHLAHGVRCCAAGLRYVLYLYMTSLEDPTKMIAEPAGYFMAPVDEERIGDVSNVLFSNGWIADEDGKVYIYYASSDTRMHVAESTVDRLVDYCLHTPADGLRSIESVRTIIAMVDHNKKILK